MCTICSSCGVLPQVVVGTPGTVKRWIMRDKYLNPRSLRIFVLDEADKMVGYPACLFLLFSCHALGWRPSA